LRLYQLHWNIPEAQSLETIIPFMKQKSDWCISGIRQLVGLDAASSGSSDMEANGKENIDDNRQESNEIRPSKVGLSVKKSEDHIVTRLSLLSHILRGAADILGDRGIVGDKDDAILIHTGRESLISQLSESNKDYVSSLRCEVLQFLGEFHELLHEQSNSNDDTSNEGDNQAAADTSKTSKNGTKDVVEAIRDSITVHEAWINVFETVINRRFHTSQDYGRAKDDLNIFKWKTRPMFVTAVLEEMKKLEVTDTAELTNVENNNRPAVQTRRYWKFHDYNYFLVCRYVFIEKQKRTHEYARATIRSSVPTANKNGNSDSDSDSGSKTLTVKCLELVRDLCGHEVNEISQQACDCFHDVSWYFGAQCWLYNIIIPMMDALLEPNSLSDKVGSDRVFSTASATLSLLSQDSVLDRIVETWALTDRYLRIILCVPALFSVLKETFQQEMLMDRMTDALLAYSDKFNNAPIPPDYENDNLISSALTSLGIDNDTGSIVSAPKGEVIAIGLRQVTHASWILLHLIGHRDISISPGVISWALRALHHGVGQPSQPIALAALVRLVALAGREKLNPTAVGMLVDMLSMSNENGADDNTGDSSKLSNVQSDKQTTTEIETVGTQPEHTMKASSSNSRQSPVSDLSASTLWTGILEAMTAYHVKVDDHEDYSDGQWTQRISELINTVPYFMATCPRDVFFVVGSYEHSIFINEHCTTFAGIFEILFSEHGKSQQTEANDENNDSTCVRGLSVGDNMVGFVKSLLALSMEISAHKEDESRSNNATKAELLSGLFRGLFKLSKRQQEQEDSTGRIDSSVIREVDELLTNFAIDHIDKVSYDYCNDWADAIMYAFLESAGTNNDTEEDNDGNGNTAVGSQLIAYIIDGLKQVGTVGSKTGEDEGYVKHDKKVLIAEALLRAAIGTSLLKRSQDITPVGKTMLELLELFRDDDMIPIHRYISTNKNLVSVAVKLAQATAHEPADFTSLVRSIHSIHRHCIEGMQNWNAGDDVESDSIMRMKNVLLTVCHWIELQFTQLPMCIYEPCVLGLFDLVMEGSSYPLPETSKKCQQTARAVCQFARPQQLKSAANTGAGSGSGITKEKGFIGNLTDILERYKGHSSPQVRKLISECGALLIKGCWTLLTVGDRKRFKNIASELIVDENPDVRIEARSFMSAYLLRKPAEELEHLAGIYIQNSEVLLAR
jgi:hypothetical protein